MTQMANLFRALADPNRLRIVNILSETSICVCDLQAVLNLSQPFISRHLAYLRRAGMVRDRREGPRVCYSLAFDSPTLQALRVFLREVQPAPKDFRSDLETLNRLEKSGKLRSLGIQIVKDPSPQSLPAGDGTGGSDNAEERAA